jgi:hypothetical protein
LAVWQDLVEPVEDQVEDQVEPATEASAVRLLLSRTLACQAARVGQEKGRAALPLPGLADVAGEASADAVEPVEPADAVLDLVEVVEPADAVLDRLEPVEDQADDQVEPATEA